MMPMDWIMGFGGGLLIGLACAGYLLVQGKVAGITGIIGGFVDGSGWDTWAERLAFVAGLVAVPWLLSSRLAADTHITGNWWVIIAGGLLVGFGTRAANGCTSGHGVCGMSRLSVRSIVATAVFVGAGALTMGLVRHVWGLI